MLIAALPRREVDMTSGVDQTDRALVARCLADDPSALTELVERHQREVYGVCLRLTHDPDAAQEVANGVFYKAYRNLRSFDADRPLRPWLLRIATNETLNFLRDQRREQAQTVPGDADTHLAAVPAGDDPATEIEVAEQRARVRAAVARLPEHYRLLITLRFFNDLSYAEIADQTGVPISTVGVQLMRARTLLRRALAGEEVADALSS